MTKEIIRTEDGFNLTTLTIEPKSKTPKAVIQFHSGTVTKKEFYLKLAKYLSEQGYIVVLFDYRGVGDSKPKSLKRFEMSIADWGKYDCVSVANWIGEKYPKLDVHLMAHSMGGQIFGLMKNWKVFKKIILLTTSSGNFNKFSPTLYRWKIKFPSIVLFPILIRILGYIPGSLGLGEDWPKGVAQDWLSNSKMGGLMPIYLHNKTSQSYYNQITSKITAWYFSDDSMSTLNTIDELELAYPNAIIKIKTIQPSMVELNKIGHFGLFKKKAEAKLWPLLLKELEE